MTESRQTIIVTIDTQDLPGTQPELGRTLRKEITPDGALGVANNTGVVEMALNGHPAVRLHLREDAMGHAVIEVTDLLARKRLGAVDVELYSLVPPRMGAKVRRERRFDGYQPGQEGDDAPHAGGPGDPVG